MDYFWKTVGASLITAILALVLEPQGKNFSIILIVAATGMISMVAAHFLEPVLDFLFKLVNIGNLNHSVLLTLMKIIGVGLTGEISAAVCKDAGNLALERGLNFLTNATVLYLSIPIYAKLIELIQQILKGI